MLKKILTQKKLRIALSVRENKRRNNHTESLLYSKPNISEKCYVLTGITHWPCSQLTIDFVRQKIFLSFHFFTAQTKSFGSTHFSIWLLGEWKRSLDNKKNS